MFTTQSLALVLTLLLSTLPSLSAAESRKPVVTTDLLQLATASELDLDPTGRRLVFVVTRADLERPGGYLRHLWMTELEPGPKSRPLTFGSRNDRSPVWSPDGSRIAFLREREGKSQIWILPVTGGEAYPLTSLEHGASEPRWSPDGRRLLFQSRIPLHSIEGTAPWPEERPGPPWPGPNHSHEGSRNQDPAGPGGSLEAIRSWLAGNAQQQDPKVIRRLDFQGERRLETDLAFTHLFVVEAVAGAQLLPLAGGFQDSQNARWSPDGSYVLCSSISYDRHPDRVRERELWRLQAGETPRRLLALPQQRLFHPLSSPDGRWIAFLAEDLNEPTFSQERLGLLDPQEGSLRWLTSNLDRSVTLPGWSPDGRFISWRPLKALSPSTGSTWKVEDWRRSSPAPRGSGNTT